MAVDMQIYIFIPAILMIYVFNKLIGLTIIFSLIACCLVYNFKFAQENSISMVIEYS